MKMPKALVDVDAHPAEDEHALVGLERKLAWYQAVGVGVEAGHGLDRVRDHPKVMPAVPARIASVSGVGALTSRPERVILPAP
jgi:hypothetical protein